MATIRDITPWPPLQWRKPGHSPAVTLAAVIERVHVHQLGIDLYVVEDGERHMLSVPFEAKGFEEIAKAVVGARGMMLCEAGTIPVD